VFKPFENIQNVDSGKIVATDAQIKKGLLINQSFSETATA